MGNPRAVYVKARAIVRQLGHTDGEPYREYKDWHLDIRSGTAYVSIWASGRMVFLSMAGVPVFYSSGPWEEYLERLFQKTAPVST